MFLEREAFAEQTNMRYFCLIFKMVQRGEVHLPKMEMSYQVALLILNQWVHLVQNGINLRKDINNKKWGEKRFNGLVSFMSEK